MHSKKGRGIVNQEKERMGEERSGAGGNVSGRISRQVLAGDVHADDLRIQLRAEEIRKDTKEPSNSLKGRLVLIPFFFCVCFFIVETV